jgi:GAF domain-containing protein
LISHENVLGALTIQSQKIAAFDTEDISILQAIADSLATALENARLFQEVQANLDEIRTLNRQYILQSWNELTPRAEEFQYIYKDNTENITEAIEPAANVVAAQIDIPFTLREQVIGHLRLEREHPGLSLEEQSFIEAVTTQTALALENARLLEASQRRAAQERRTTNIASKIWASTEIETILQTTLQELGRSLRISDGVIELGLNPVREIKR